MAIDHVIEPDPNGSAGVTLRVRGSDDQARALTGILGRTYPGRHHKFMPLVGADFTHAFRVCDTADGLRRKWPVIEMRLLLGEAPIHRTGTVRQAMPGKAGSVERAIGSRSPDDALTPGKALSAHSSGSTPRTVIDVSDPLAVVRAQSREVTFDEELERICCLPLRARREPLERLYERDDPSTLKAGVLLAELLGSDPETVGSSRQFELLVEQARPTARDAIRASYVRALRASGQDRRAIDLLDPHYSSGELRAQLGLALCSVHEPHSALPHFAYAWTHPEARSLELARAYAPVAWALGQYHAAAEPYRYLVTHAALGLEAANYCASDYVAIAELARCGYLEDLSDGLLLGCIEAFCARASATERAPDDVHQHVLHGLELARRVSDSTRLANAYRNVIDDVLQRREGASLVSLLAEILADHHSGLLCPVQRFDLLDEIGDNLLDYPLLLRQPLIDSYEDLLRHILNCAETRDAPFPTMARDLYRSLNDLDRRSVACERYRQLLASKPTVADVRESAVAPVGLGGKRVALVGGHSSMRREVEKRLTAWGAEVDHVPPPTSGRINERAILDRIRWSDLVLLIVSYMGHDMSTIVANLESKNKLCGQVVVVDSRGTTGVMRAITKWAGHA